ncbi:hypothetical protein HanXRQr2_Chr12g0530341 [Helianthus annuus]|uniref:Uncharacterized protein n=1 Tax=Helianthus annuus TaxID=4232 RepID=A0A9K3ENA0_HELAN|nr:hypothetical protein HanXRQr2_Chr12g0530341 [Helianthus annuus]KAJ0861827.1 hypothetical protein HanPSC8_Chr12g0511021 [Helianthus annuus]
MPCTSQNFYNSGPSGWIDDEPGHHICLQSWAWIAFCQWVYLSGQALLDV